MKRRAFNVSPQKCPASGAMTAAAGGSSSGSGGSGGGGGGGSGGGAACLANRLHAIAVDRQSPTRCVEHTQSATAVDIDWKSYTLVTLVAIVCYLNGLSGDFVHDDIPAITKNKDVLGTSPILHVFKNDFWGTPMSDINSHKSYRPLTVLSFR